MKQAMVNNISVEDDSWRQPGSKSYYWMIVAGLAIMLVFCLIVAWWWGSFMAVSFSSEPIAGAGNHANFVKPLMHDAGKLLILGSDHIGRNLWLQMADSVSRAFIWTGLIIIFAYVTGALAGILAGFYQGRLTALWRLLNGFLLIFPPLLFAILFLHDINNQSSDVAQAWLLLCAIALPIMAMVLRHVRAWTLMICQHDFIRMAKIRDEKPIYIIFIEIFPNMMWLLLSDLLIRYSHVLVLLVLLGFLGIDLPFGLGLWGQLIGEGRQYLSVTPHIIIVPCMVLISVMTGLYLLAGGIRRYHQQHLRKII